MSFLKNLLFLTLLLSSYLFANQQIPHLLPLLQPVDDQKGRVYQSLINKDQTRILIRYHDAIQLIDATGNKLLYHIERDEDGQIYKMDLRKNGYIINFVKEIKRDGIDPISLKRNWHKKMFPH